MALLKPQSWWPGCDVLDPLCPDQAWPLWEGAGSAVEAVGRAIGDTRRYRGVWAGTGSRWAAGPAGTVARFNGTDDIVNSTRDAGQYPSDKPFSAEAFVKRTGAGTQASLRNTIVKTYYPAVGGWALLWMGDLDRFECVTYGPGGVGYAKTPNGSVVLNTWHHIVLVFHGGSAGNVSAYLDGQFTELTTTNHGYTWSYHATDPTRIAKIGGGYAASPPTDFFEGDIAGIWTYRWALSPVQIVERYQDLWRSMRARRSAVLWQPIPVGDNDPGADAAEVFMGGSQEGEVFMGGRIAGEIHG